MGHNLTLLYEEAPPTTSIMSLGVLSTGLAWPSTAHTFEGMVPRRSSSELALDTCLLTALASSPPQCQEVLWSSKGKCLLSTWEPQACFLESPCPLSIDSCAKARWTF